MSGPAPLLLPAQPGWDSAEFGATVRHLSEIVRKRSCATLFANVRADLVALDVEGCCVPASVSDVAPGEPPANSETGNLTVAARMELAHAPPGPRRWLAQASIAAGAVALRPFAIDRMVRLYPAEFGFQPPPTLSPDFVRAATAAAIARFPGHALKWGALNPILDAGTLDALRACGYATRASRPAFIFRAGARRNANLRGSRNTYLRGGRAVERLTRPDAETWERFADLYAMVNLRPDRIGNVRITAEGFRRMHEAGLIEFLTSRDADGRLRAFCVYTARDGVMAPKYMGYDRNDPHRRIEYAGFLSTVNLAALQGGYAVRMGYGADRFKRARGAEAHVEYAACFFDHLPWPRRAAWRIYNDAVDRQARPIIEALIARHAT